MARSTGHEITDCAFVVNFVTRILDAVLCNIFIPHTASCIFPHISKTSTEIFAGLYNLKEQITTRNEVKINHTTYELPS
jgi:hypothetical protein